MNDQWAVSHNSLECIVAYPARTFFMQQDTYSIKSFLQQLINSIRLSHGDVPDYKYTFTAKGVTRGVIIIGTYDTVKVTTFEFQTVRMTLTVPNHFSNYDILCMFEKWIIEDMRTA